MTTPAPTQELRVLVFAASLRAESLNRRLANLAAKAAERYGATVDLASMRDFDVALYDGDLETASGIPRGAQELRSRLLANDAFILASPEYNGSMPGTVAAGQGGRSGEEKPVARVERLRPKEPVCAQHRRYVAERNSSANWRGRRTRTPRQPS